MRPFIIGALIFYGFVLGTGLIALVWNWAGYWYWKKSIAHDEAKIKRAESYRKGVDV